MTDPEIVDVLGNILVGAPDDRANAALDAAISRLSATCATTTDHHSQETVMTPTLGRIVLYTLNDSDVEQIQRQRWASAWPAGAQAHMGNSVNPGQQVPAIITAVWSDTVNLRCVLDGTDEFWATSRRCYTQETPEAPTGAPMGMWQWPARV